MKPFLLALTSVGLVCSTLVSGQGGDPGYGKPKRLNKMIELLAAGQPVYDVGVTGGGYEEGKRRALHNTRRATRAHLLSVIPAQAGIQSMQVGQNADLGQSTRAIS